MTREKAKARWQALRNMTVARGCTKEEAATATAIAAKMDAAWGFTAPRVPWGGVAQEARRDERRAAKRWGWEYRNCGKCRRCRGSTRKPHGPYRYSKRRRGSHVRSIYMGGGPTPKGGWPT